MKYIKEYKKYKLNDYVKLGNIHKIFKIIKIDKYHNKYQIKEQTGTIYGGVYWAYEEDLEPATEIEIKILKYNL